MENPKLNYKELNEVFGNVEETHYGKLPINGKDFYILLKGANVSFKMYDTDKITEEEFLKLVDEN